jgi:hypothetical protein
LLSLCFSFPFLSFPFLLSHCHTAMAIFFPLSHHDTRTILHLIPLS